MEGNEILFIRGNISRRKTGREETLRYFKPLSPGKAKQEGKIVPLRLDWDDVKLGIMHNVVYEKFKQNPDLAKKLLATGNEELVEGNYWHDTYWGVCNGVGENHLGKILMQVREEMKKGC